MKILEMSKELNNTNKYLLKTFIIYSLFYLINFVIYYFVYTDYFGLFEYEDVEYIVLGHSVLFLSIVYLYYIFFHNKNELAIEGYYPFKSYFLIFIVFYFLTSLFSPFFDYPRQDYFTFNSDLLFTNKYLTGFVSTVIVMSIFEELFFREILLNPLIKGRLFINILTTSLLFSFSHFYLLDINIDEKSLFNFFQMFIFGIILSLTRIKYGLIFSIFGHILYNLVTYLYTTGVSNLYLLDYLKSYFYWIFYFSSVIIIIYFIFNVIYRLSVNSRG